MNCHRAAVAVAAVLATLPIAWPAAAVAEDPVQPPTETADLSKVPESPAMDFAAPIGPEEWKSVFPQVVLDLGGLLKDIGEMPQSPQARVSEELDQLAASLGDTKMWSWASSPDPGTPIDPATAPEEAIELAVKYREARQAILRDDGLIAEIEVGVGEDHLARLASLNRLLDAATRQHRPLEDPDGAFAPTYVHPLLDTVDLRVWQHVARQPPPNNAWGTDYSPARSLTVLGLLLALGATVETDDPRRVPIRPIDLTGRVMLGELEGDCGGNRYMGGRGPVATPVSEPECDDYMRLATSVGVPAAGITHGSGAARRRVTAVPATVLITAYVSWDGTAPQGRIGDRILHQAAVLTDAQGFYRHRFSVPPIAETVSQRIFIRTDVYLQGQVMGLPGVLNQGDGYVRSYLPHPNRRHLASFTYYGPNGPSAETNNYNPLGNLMSRAEQMRVLPGGGRLLSHNHETGVDEHLAGYFGSKFTLYLRDPRYAGLEEDEAVQLVALPLTGISDFGYHVAAGTSVGTLRILDCALASRSNHYLGNSGDCGQTVGQRDNPLPGRVDSYLTSYAGVVRAVDSFRRIMEWEHRNIGGLPPGWYQPHERLFGQLFGNHPEAVSGGARGVHIIHDLRSATIRPWTNPVPAEVWNERIHLLDVETAHPEDVVNPDIYAHMSGTTSELVGRLVVDRASGRQSGQELDETAPDTGELGWKGFANVSSSGVPGSGDRSTVTYFDRGQVMDYNHAFRVGAGIAIGSLLRTGRTCRISSQYRDEELPAMRYSIVTGSTQANLLQWVPGYANSNGVPSWLGLRRLGGAPAPALLDRLNTLEATATVLDQVNQPEGARWATAALVDSHSPFRYATLVCDVLDDIGESPAARREFDGRRFTFTFATFAHSVMAGRVDIAQWQAMLNNLRRLVVGPDVWDNEPPLTPSEVAARDRWIAAQPRYRAPAQPEAVRVALKDFLVAIPPAGGTQWNVGGASKVYADRFLDFACAPMAPSQVLNRLSLSPSTRDNLLRHNLMEVPSDLVTDGEVVTGGEDGCLLDPASGRLTYRP